jgi:hypothetical protein
MRTSLSSTRGHIQWKGSRACFHYACPGRKMPDGVPSPLFHGVRLQPPGILSWWFDWVNVLCLPATDYWCRVRFYEDPDFRALLANGLILDSTRRLASDLYLSPDNASFLLRSRLAELARVDDPIDYGKTLLVRLLSNVTFEWGSRLSWIEEPVFDGYWSLSLITLREALETAAKVLGECGRDKAQQQRDSSQSVSTGDAEDDCRIGCCRESIKGVNDAFLFDHGCFMTAVASNAMPQIVDSILTPLEVAWLNSLSEPIRLNSCVQTVSWSMSRVFGNSWCQARAASGACADRVQLSALELRCNVSSGNTRMYDQTTLRYKTTRPRSTAQYTFARVFED